MYKMMKVYDCQHGMPEDIKRVFFDTVQNSSYSQGNDCYVTHEVMLPTYILDDETGDLAPCEEYTALDAWLLDNGAFGGEYVLIKHWW